MPAQVGKEGAQGFYKVWVSDAPIEAEEGAANPPRCRKSYEKKRVPKFHCSIMSSFVV